MQSQRRYITDVFIAADLCLIIIWTMLEIKKSQSIQLVKLLFMCGKLIDLFNLSLFPYDYR